MGGDADTYAGVFEAMADRLTDGEFDDWQNGDFLNYVGEYMHDWLDCLEALETASEPSAPVPATGDD